MHGLDEKTPSQSLTALNKALSATPPLSLDEPKQHQLPIVLSSPHSGRNYPDYFIMNSRLEAHELRASEDYFVDLLLENCLELGVPLLKANYPRAFVDLNREPYELDQRMFKERLPSYANTRSMRVMGGLGTIARVVAENYHIYSASLDLDEALARIEHIYRPWHQVLGRKMAQTYVDFGKALLLDCHSMPSGKQGIARTHNSSSQNRADFIIGDRYGTSCSKQLADCAQEYLIDCGFHVARNKPYAGGFIAEHYGRPAKGLHAMQLEINRALYVDETSLDTKDNLGEIQLVLKGLVSEMGAALQVGSEQKSAAE